MKVKNTHFSNRDSLNDAMKNLGVKHCDIDMSMKRAPVDSCMSISDVIEKPRNFKKGGLTPSMPVDKMHRLKPAKASAKGYKKGGCAYAEG